MRAKTEPTGAGLQMTGEPRPTSPDAAAMARVLVEIIAVKGTGVDGDADFVRARYIEHPARVACTVAIVGGVLAGFLALKRAWEGNPFDVPTGWGIIGTHISPSVARRGGRARPVRRQPRRGGRGRTGHHRRHDRHLRRRWPRLLRRDGVSNLAQTGRVRMQTLRSRGDFGLRSPR